MPSSCFSCSQEVCSIYFGHCAPKETSQVLHMRHAIKNRALIQHTHPHFLSLCLCVLFYLQEINTTTFNTVKSVCLFVFIFYATISVYTSGFCNYAVIFDWSFNHLQSNLPSKCKWASLSWRDESWKSCCSAPCRSCHVICSVPPLSFPTIGQGPASGQSHGCTTFHVHTAANVDPGNQCLRNADPRELWSLLFVPENHPGVKIISAIHDGNILKHPKHYKKLYHCRMCSWVGFLCVFIFWYLYTSLLSS